MTEEPISCLLVVELERMSACVVLLLSAETRLIWDVLKAGCGMVEEQRGLKLTAPEKV
jgi:hypothetical protein